MLAGYYTIASGMLTRQREIDVLGNNLVNAQTPGYRADRLLISSFDQELLMRKEAYNSGELAASASTSTIAGKEVTLFGMGNVKDTGRELDMAIGGEGFYNVQGEDGNIYLTRNGGFDIDADGYLILPNQGRVLGQSGPIRVGQAGITVEETGDVYTSNGRYLDKLLVTAPQDGAALTKLENAMFQFEGGAQLPAAEEYVVAQEKLEISNVDMNQEMTYLIEAQRAFQACSSALQMVDAMNRKAATQVGAL